MSSPPSGRSTRLLARGSWREGRRIAEILRKETVGGLLLLAATVIALLWANSPWRDGYTSLRDATVGPSAVHLDLTLGHWAADGLLAIFFFVAGLELKREFVAGDLREVRRAAVPVAAALGGVIAPALLFVAVNAAEGGVALQGWAIPTATDIAFALAVLAVVGSHLPAALRTFLLTLAVVDDLMAITIIALFYTRELSMAPLLVAVIPLGVFTVLVQRRVRHWWLLLPLALIIWTLVHASGVHATVAGVMMGFAVPVVRSEQGGGPDGGPGLAEHFEHRFRPLSTGLAVPVFALLSAGVTIGGLSGLRTSLSDRVAVGVVVGLVVGKGIGVFLGTFLVARLTRAELDDDLAWVDVMGLALMSGIGFTVSLLIGELAYGFGSERDEHVKVAVLVGSVAAAALGATVLATRNRVYRRLQEADEAEDEIGDAYQR